MIDFLVRLFRGCQHDFVLVISPEESPTGEGYIACDCGKVIAFNPEKL